MYRQMNLTCKTALIFIWEKYVYSLTNSRRDPRSGSNMWGQAAELKFIDNEQYVFVSFPKSFIVYRKKSDWASNLSLCHFNALTALQGLT